MPPRPARCAGPYRPAAGRGRALRSGRTTWRAGAGQFVARLPCGAAYRLADRVMTGHAEAVTADDGPPLGGLLALRLGLEASGPIAAETVWSGTTCCTCGPPGRRRSELSR